MLLRRASSAFLPLWCLAFLIAAGAAYGETLSQRDALRDRLSAPAGPAQLLGEQEGMIKFYEGRDYVGLWFDATGPTRAAQRVMRELESAGDWGLNAADFALPDAVRGDRTRTPEEAAEAELALSAAVLKYARHARGGRIENPERELSDFIDRRPQTGDPLETLKRVADAAEPDEALRRLHPQHEQFQKLREVYARERQAAAAGVGRLAAEGPLLAKGIVSDDVVALRARLGVQPRGDAPGVFDGELADAVKAFQRANGLSADGMVGQKTRKALQGQGNRLETMRANLEQWRWMPADLGERHLFVNIASQEVYFVEDGKTVLTENVIVGKPQTPTPVFSKAMRTLVLRPSWYLPDSIKKERLLSVSRRGTSLESLGLVVKKGSDGQELVGGLEQREPLALRDLPTLGRWQRARQGEVPLSQQVLRLSARHAGQAPVQCRGARVQPRLHPAAQSA